MAENRTISIPLLIERYLMEYSDEHHPVTLTDMQKYLEDNGYSADRRTVYNALHALSDLGMYIHRTKSDKKTVYWTDHLFRKEEIFLLNSELADSAALSPNTVASLQEKLRKQLPVHERKEIPDIPPVIGGEESIDLLPSIRILLNAISGTHPITFRYFDLDYRRNRIYRKNTYRMVPYAIASSNGKFYCILYSFTHKDFGNYRIDKMADIMAEEETVPSVPFSLTDHMRTSFQMYHGQGQTVTCRFDLSFAGYVYDHFSRKDIIISGVDEKSFTASLRTAVTPTLISWIMQFSDRITVLSPDSLKQQLAETARTIYEKYGKEIHDEQ